jgi:hypothetical protein
MEYVSRKKWYAVTPMKTRNDEEGGWSSTLFTSLRRTPSQNHLRQQPAETRIDLRID